MNIVKTDILITEVQAKEQEHLPMPESRRIVDELVAQLIARDEMIEQLKREQVEDIHA